MLQHGSLLMDCTHEQLADFMLIDNEERRGTVRRLLRSRTTDLSALLNRTVGFEEVARAVMSGFVEAWGLKLSEGELSDDETETAQMLATEYRTTS